MRIRIIVLLIVFFNVAYSQQKDSLINEFQKECDEFEGHCFYFHKNARWKNGFYPYILEKDHKYTLQFHISYIGKDWLFVHSVQAKIKDMIFDVVNNADFKQSIVSDGISEDIDFVVNKELMTKLNFIVKDDIIKLRFSGVDYFEDRTLHKYQSDPIEKTMKLYNLLTPQK